MNLSELILNGPAKPARSLARQAGEVKLWRNGGLHRKRSHSGQQAAERQKGFEPSLLRRLRCYDLLSAAISPPTPRYCRQPQDSKARHQRDVRLTWRKTMGQSIDRQGKRHCGRPKVSAIDPSQRRLVTAKAHRHRTPDRNSPGTSQRSLKLLFPVDRLSCSNF
jgi:hypothetical protein